MTRIVTTVSADRPDALVKRAKAAGGDLVELRLDLLDELDVPVIEDVLSRIDRPVMATVRSAGEGGKAELGGDDRARLLRAVIEAAPDWVDLEWNDRDLVRPAHRNDVRVVLSRHLEEPATAGRILAEIEKALALDADVAKVAMPAPDQDAVAVLIDAASRARRRGFPYTLMGLEDAVVRALAPTLGMAFVYAAPDDGTPAAEGQLPVSVVQKLGDLQRREDPVKLAGLLGGDVRRSLSPPMHNAAFEAMRVPATYVPLSVDAGRLGRAVDALKTLPFVGVNVTIPHKEAIVDHLDRLAVTAERVGAVNTVLVEGGDLVGHNTDVYGIRKALEPAGPPRGPLLVVGAGGAARAAVTAVRDRPVRVVNRTPEHAEALVGDLGGEAFPLEDLDRAADGAALVVNATPVSPDVPWDRVADGAVALDLVYRPRDTAFLEAAQAGGHRSVTGDRVLLHQAARAFELWTRHDAPLAIMDDALEAAYGR